MIYLFVITPFKPEFFNTYNASVRFLTIGNPCRLNEVFNNAPTPVIFEKASIIRSDL